MLADGVAIEVGVARFIGIDMDVGVGVGMEELVVGRLTSWWRYRPYNDQIGGFG